MSVIVSTPVGRFRKVKKPLEVLISPEPPPSPTDLGWLWECPGCLNWYRLSPGQWSGVTSVNHDADGCPGHYHETRNFQLALDSALKEHQQESEACLTALNMPSNRTSRIC